MLKWDRNKIWKAGDGRQLRIGNMTDEHLINVLNWLEDPVYSGRPNNQQRTEEYFHLRCEAMSRGLRWRHFAGCKLHDGDLHLEETLSFEPVGGTVTGRFFTTPAPRQEMMPGKYFVKEITGNTRFIREGYQLQGYFRRVIPIGVLHHMVMNYFLVRSGSSPIGSGLYTFSDGTLRALITQERSGETFFIAANDVVNVLKTK
jgi:hypothetical protein